MFILADMFLEKLSIPNAQSDQTKPNLIKKSQTSLTCKTVFLICAIHGILW